MKKARMNISHSRFILSKLKIFGEIVTTLIIYFFLKEQCLLYKNTKLCFAQNLKTNLDQS